MTESILEEAQRIIHGARNASYGHPRENFQNIADLWAAHLGVPVSQQQVAELMILMKVARLKNGYHRDSVTDVAGYAGTIERLQEPVEGEPRVWAKLADVPKDVRVKSAGGCFWAYYEEHGSWLWTSSESRYDRTGPFTEIIEQPVELDDYPTGTYARDVPGMDDPVAALIGVPRVWQSLVDVPFAVRVKDNDGDIWKHNGTGWQWSHRGGPTWINSTDLGQHDASAPFTELLEEWEI